MKLWRLQGPADSEVNKRGLENEARVEEKGGQKKRVRDGNSPEAPSR